MSLQTPQAQGQSQKKGPWIIGSSSLSLDGGLVVGALLRCLHTPPGQSQKKGPWIRGPSRLSFDGGLLVVGEMLKLLLLLVLGASPLNGRNLLDMSKTQAV